MLNQFDVLLSEQFEMPGLGGTEDRLYTKLNFEYPRWGRIGTIGFLMCHFIGFTTFRGL